MGYTISDFSESLKLVNLEDTTPVEVIRAHGSCGDYAEWDGGFVMRLSDGRYAYLSGWCDTTGWGCQDGSDIIFANSLEELELPVENLMSRENIDWDEYPADLNLWIANGMKDSECW